MRHALYVLDALLHLLFKALLSVRREQVEAAHDLQLW
jgi:hypothetical protein